MVRAAYSLAAMRALYRRLKKKHANKPWALELLGALEQKMEEVLAP